MIRPLAILKLCIAFTALSLLLSYPFMGELFAQKSKKLLLEAVGKTPQEITPSTFLEKVKMSGEILLIKIPLMKRLMLLFSIVIPILLLLRKEGAKEVAWLLPILSICCLLENQWHGFPSEKSAEYRLFPSEKYLIEKYLDEPLSNRLTIQKEQLTAAWKRFLAKEWAPAAENFEEQVRLGEYAFNAARLEAQAKQPARDLKQTFRRRESLTFLALAVFWNILFAYGVNRISLDKAVVKG